MKQSKKKRLSITEGFRQIVLVNAPFSKATKEKTYDWALAIDYNN